MEETKLRCRVCRHRKEPDQFYVDKQSTTGHRSACKTCEKRRYRKHYATTTYGARQRARQRALARLAEVHPEQFEMIFEEELHRG